MPSGRQDDIKDRISHVISNRVDRICLVLECCSDNKNYLACLRTCDILGIQNVWIVEEPLPASHPIQHSCTGSVEQPNGCVQLKAQQDKRSSVEQGRKKGRIARASSQWLDIQHFSSSSEAIQQLKAAGWTIWATDLNPGAVSLTQPGLQLPTRLAIVLGNEARGVSDEIRAAADRCVYLPMYGFTESLNVSVATALVLQTLIAAEPSVRGDFSPGRARQLEAKWRAAASRSHDNRAGALQQQQQRRSHKLAPVEQQQQQHCGTRQLSEEASAEAGCIQYIELQEEQQAGLEHLQIAE